MHLGIQHLSNIDDLHPCHRFAKEDGAKLRDEILFGTPAGRVGLPVALYNRHLAVLQHKLKNLNKGGPEDMDDETRAYLEKNASLWPECERFLYGQLMDTGFFNNSRSTAAKPFFNKIFGYQDFSVFMPGTIYSTRLDNDKEIPRAIVEIKQSHIDPGEPVLLSVQRYAIRLLNLKVSMKSIRGSRILRNARPRTRDSSIRRYFPSSLCA